MRLNSIHLVNFRQHAETRIDFDSGLTGIIGPNGSGKTTILEAIAWAIYGNPAARGTRDTIRHLRAGPRATVRVELEFDLGRHRYRICRGLTTAELYLDGGSVPIATTISGVTELVTARLGMSRDEFFNTYFTGQKELSVMAAMGPSERAQFLSRVLGYERLRAAQRLLRDRRSAIVGELGGLRQGMPDPEVVGRAVMEAEQRLAEAAQRSSAAAQRLAGAEESLNAVRPLWEAAQRERERLQALLSELLVLEQEAAALDRDRDRLERELGEVSSATAERAKLERELAGAPAAREEFARLEALATADVRRQALIDAMRAAEEELERLGERHAQVTSAPELEAELAQLLDVRREELGVADAALEARRTELARDRQEAETKLAALRKQFVDLKQQRDKLASTGEEELCPTCLRPLGASLRSVLDLLDSQIETVRVDGGYFKSRVDQLQHQPEDLIELEERRRLLSQEVSARERQLVAAQLAVQERTRLIGDVEAKQRRLAALQADLAALPTGYDARRHAELRTELERLAPLEARAARLAVQIERGPLLLRERGEVFEAIGRVQLRLADLREARDQGQMSETGFAELRSSHDAASEELRGAQLASVAAAGEENACRGTLAHATQVARDLRERQRLVRELDVQRRLHDELDRAYTDLRTDLNFQLRPELSELASAFLAELSDGRYSELELDDQYNVIVLEDGVPKPVISGGEEDLANLVLRLAISQMIAERAGQPFSLLVLDEIFGSLDDLRRANVVELLRGLQDRFEQVILITHIESVRDGLDRVITVRYDEERGASVVEQPDEKEELVAVNGTVDVQAAVQEPAVVEQWR